MVNSQNNHCLSLSPQDVPIIMKTKHPVHMVFEVVTSDGDVMPPFILPYCLTLNKEAFIKYLEEVGLNWMKRVAVDSTLNNRTLHQATQAGEPIVSCEKISATTSPLIFGCPTPRIVILLMVGHG